MNQSIRNKKNANYKKNLVKRNGITKSIDYMKDASDGIKKSKTLNHPIYEFITTRRHGSIVTREVAVFKWNKIALDAKKSLSNSNVYLTKDELKAINNKKIDVPATLTNVEYKNKYKEVFTTKIENFKNLPFSILHNKLVKTAESIADRKARQDEAEKKHNKKIDMLIIERKSRMLDRRTEMINKKPFTIKVIMENSSNKLYDFETIPSNGKYDTVLAIASSMHNKLKSRPNYHHISIEDNNTKEILAVFNKAA